MNKEILTYFLKNIDVTLKSKMKGLLALKDGPFLVHPLTSGLIQALVV
jgi:hypothetical protein